MTGSDPRFGVFAETMRDVAWVLDVESLRFVYVSPSVEALTGFTPSEVMEGALEDYLGVDKAAFIRQMVKGQAEAIAAGRVLSDDFFAIDLEQPRRDGTTIWTELVGRYRWEPSTGRLEVWGVTRDVSQRHALEVRLRDEGLVRRAVIDSLLDPLVVLEAVRDAGGAIVDFVYLDANAAACADNEMSRDELVGRRLSAVAPSERDSGLFDAYAAVIETDVPLVIDDRLISDHTHGGEARWYDLRGVKVGNSLSLSWRDVSDRHESAEALRREAELREAVVESMVDPHALLQAMRDDSGRIVDLVYVSANAAACLDFRLPVDQLVGARLSDVAPIEVELGLWTEYVRVIETGEHLILDDVTLPDEASGGELRFYEIRGVRVGDLLSLAWRDVTERRAIDRALADSEEHYRLLASNATDVVIRLTDQAVVVWASPSLEEVLGWDPGSWIGRPFEDFIADGGSGGEAVDVGSASASGDRRDSRGVLTRRLRMTSGSGRVHIVEVRERSYVGPTGRQCRRPDRASRCRHVPGEARRS